MEVQQGRRGRTPDVYSNVTAARLAIANPSEATDAACKEIVSLPALDDAAALVPPTVLGELAALSVPPPVEKTRTLLTAQ